ncbi:hypothetical protein [Streptomyces sp. DH10]|uniref:hypothetical protein n=1 Tax=Streptomyces sp. DH10 TaxID=3040121 RepID=UPI002442F6F4|nr:hypothetical protein [Streptomyces sp. DH10]MDG9711177.1 hypothetical protein [Streptomyces sp. DH10]
MVRVPVEIAKCDVCGSDDAVAEAIVTLDAVTVEVDLCREHKEPLGEIMTKGRRVERTRAPRKAVAPRKPAHAVVPIEDLPEFGEK